MTDGAYMNQHTADRLKAAGVNLGMPMLVYDAGYWGYAGRYRSPRAWKRRHATPRPQPRRQWQRYIPNGRVLVMAGGHDDGSSGIGEWY